MWESNNLDGTAGEEHEAIAAEAATMAKRPPRVIEVLRIGGPSRTPLRLRDPCQLMPALDHPAAD